MSSQARSDLDLGLMEVRALLRHKPAVKGSSIVELQTARNAHLRACAVLLCSHYERFIYALNEESIACLNSAGLPSQDIPERIRLLQVRSALEELAQMQWDGRREKLEEFAPLVYEGFTRDVPITHLVPDLLLTSMKSPKVKDVHSYFKLFGIDTIIARICRTNKTRGEMNRGLTSLVDYRNAIAHGDLSAQPSKSELTLFINLVEKFSKGTEREMDRALKKRFRVQTWN